jgi:hypothetical protein
VSAPLLAAYGAAGGFPPATMESLRVLDDGTARAIVGSPWPDGTPLDEAGVYETTLEPADLETLRALTADPDLRAAAGEHGPIHSDSGARSISLGDDVTIRWGAFAELPDAVTDAEQRLRAILARVREHPVAVLRVRGGEEIQLSNPGREPVSYRVDLSVGDGTSLAAYRAATLVSSDPSQGELGPGETRSVAGGQGRNVFARGALEVAVDDRPLALDAFVVSQSG